MAPLAPPIVPGLSTVIPPLLEPFKQIEHCLDADASFPNLLPKGVVTATDQTPTIDTEVSGIQLSSLSVAGKCFVAIDFRKGCYMGQELTIHTEHRGVVRKRILPCVLYPDNGQQPPPGNLDLVAGYRPEIEDGVTAEQIPREASIGRAPGGKKGRSAGKWLSGVGNVGLALCRLEIMTDVVLPGEASSGAGGFGDGDEFVVGVGAGEGEEGRKVRIKAFVPE
ncbi:uncharacterized protein C8A04DRAFT_28319 [Dichotomopilus funicola]|uniref:CAF17 C-terminal domain-containing protein n=1 Tax=Dichotomopilus funicola TaxID=1934379 RepID=A0AAN6ZLS5_9PEZI|nr:hypothetical protein C8A04DRAFT_28319 [Dichotomopilus funicola]